MVSRSNGALQFSGGHPRKSDHTGKKTGTGFRDGTGRFVQSVQSGPVYLSLVRAPEDEEQAYAYFTVPDELAAEEPKSIGLWKVYDVEGIQVAVRALEGEITLGTTIPDKKGRSKPLLKMPGHNSGFLLWVLEDDSDLEAKLAAVKLDASAWQKDSILSVVIPDVVKMGVSFNPAPKGDNHGNRAAHATINGELIDLKSWPIFSGPFVTQEPGLLRISDGNESYQIDFRGELPVYKKLP